MREHHRTGARPSRRRAGERRPPVTALGRLAGHCYDRRRLVLVLWIVAIIAITVVAQIVGTDFKNKFTAGNTPSQQAQNILQERFPSQAGDTADIVFHTATPIADNKAAIDDVLARVRPMPYVEGVTSPFSAAGAHQIAPHGNIAFAQVQFTTDTADIPTGAIKNVVSAAQAEARPGFQVALGGNPISAAVTAAPGAERGDRHHGGAPHHAAGLRLGGGHGPAGDHRAGRPRHRRRACSSCSRTSSRCRTSRPRWRP